MDDLCILLFTVPLLTVAFAGIFQVWDEMFGNKPSLPIEGMGRPTAKVQFGLLQPIMARSILEPPDLRAELPIALRPAVEDSTAVPLTVVGNFSVLGSFTQAEASAAEVTASSPKTLPAAAPPISQAYRVPASWESGTNDSSGHA